MFEDSDEKVDLTFHETEKTEENRSFKDVTKLLILVTSFNNDKNIVNDQKAHDKPNSSRDSSEFEDVSIVKKNSVFCKKIELLVALCTNLLLLLAMKLHKISRSYSYVMKILAAEKKKLKVLYIVVFMEFIFKTLLSFRQHLLVNCIPRNPPIILEQESFLHQTSKLITLILSLINKNLLFRIKTLATTDKNEQKSVLNKIDDDL